MLLCADGEGYANLCDLLTLAHRERLKPHLELEHLATHSVGLFAVADVSAWLHAGKPNVAVAALQRLSKYFEGRLFVEAVHHHRAGDAVIVEQLGALSQTLGLSLVATKCSAPRNTRRLYPL